MRVTAAAFTAAQLEAARCRADTGGTESLRQLMDDAVTFIEPLIVALRAPTDPGLADDDEPGGSVDVRLAHAAPLGLAEVVGTRP